jgi:3-deoxy-7-phosphoheptulonate synthase
MELLKKNNLPTSIMVDCSHANSNKDHNLQGAVLTDIVDQNLAGNKALNSVMIESNLEAGNQEIPEDISQLRYGVSITDKCIDWKTTEDILRTACKRLAAG